MVNLCGFHQPIACALGPPRPTPAAAAATSYGPRIAKAVYQELALVGCRIGCPLIPILVRTAIDLAGIPAILSILVETGGTSVLLEISIDNFAALMSQYLNDRLCSNC